MIRSIAPAFAFFALASLLEAAPPPPRLDLDPDSDGDGISDFRENHKHFTDPKSRDSDKDGVPDGDWRERSEFAYTVRTIVQVAKFSQPVDPSVFEDDYQDARVLDETERYVELEVIHYPFNTVAESITADRDWRKTAANAKFKEWVEPGPTSNWDDGLRKKILADLKAAGIDVAVLDDKTLVEKAAVFFLKRAEYHDGFSTFITAFGSGGKPFVPDDLAEAAERGRSEKKLSNEEQWQRELFSKGMYENGARGSCTSSAIYLNGCLRAIGIPTRIVLCIPAVDANDEREMDLVRKRIRHPEVRGAIQKALENARGAWTSHTFNEVYVGGRWRRLNYDGLGQNILDSDTLGLMTHVGTYGDWADADMPKTWGRRQGLQRYDDEFGWANPYSALTIADRVGAHAKVTIPEEQDPAALAPESLSIAEVVWSDAERIPAEMRREMAGAGTFGILCRVDGNPEWESFRSFTEIVDQRFYLEAAGHPTLSIAHGVGGVTFGGTTWLLFGFGPADQRDLATGVRYRLRPRNESKSGRRWIVPDGLRVERTG